ncbi:hypothetical protein [Liquorilactobacillus mali]|uniref:hypothetical protein n=1 Tax=Liquorilactobacillus mali TaxID=1618 RepID=UPI002350FA1E|nr:hypothetical protein [Liquorilactobacillus mali]
MVTASATDYVGYEYHEIAVNEKFVDFYSDNYPNFGWKITAKEQSTKTAGSKIILKLKRDRYISNKAELTRLQRKFESQINQLEGLERNKELPATIIAITIGLIGTIFMGLSVWAYNDGLLLSLLVSIPGFIGWILPYFCYQNFKKKYSHQLAPQENRLYDDIYETCQKAHKLSSY